MYHLGGAPPVVRTVPGQDICFLAVGRSTVLATLDRRRGMLKFERMDIPGVRYAAPMFVKTSHGTSSRYDALHKEYCKEANLN